MILPIIKLVTHTFFRFWFLFRMNASFIISNLPSGVDEGYVRDFFKEKNFKLPKNCLHKFQTECVGFTYPGEDLDRLISLSGTSIDSNVIHITIISHRLYNHYKVSALKKLKLKTERTKKNIEINKAYKKTIDISM